MFFIIVFLIGVVSTLLLIKVNSKSAKWIPAIISLFATILIGIKARFFPAPDMAALGEILYVVIFGTITIGAFFGGVFVHFWKKKIR